MKMSILLSVVFLLSVKTGFAQTGTCRSVCSESKCITVNRGRVDFQTAEESCRGRSGELMAFQPDTDESLLDILSRELSGNFWIGLRLPAGICSNLSAPLRGYEWSSGNTDRRFMPSFTAWTDRVKVCSPHCVSLSDDQKWTERLCSDKTDGFLCRTKHKDACQTQELSDLNFFPSSKGCSNGPCEHQCTDVKGGFQCSCFPGYIPDKKDPRKCKMHCGQHKCPVMCDWNNICFCPDGFIKNDKFCEDIDECDHEQCDQKCDNTFGSFMCSCQEGFVLKDEVKCIKVEDSESFVVTSPVVSFVKPAINNNTLKASSVTAGPFLWIWIFVAAALLVLIFVVRFYVFKCRKLSEQSANQQSTATGPVDNL